MKILTNPGSELETLGEKVRPSTTPGDSRRQQDLEMKVDCGVRATDIKFCLSDFFEIIEF